ncbi:replicative DNA helicase [Candidatus Saccharibacteria bacterium CPR2]|nr:replicative DNA helicase [Candidatus Saccharibacteria bacterium CPR2]
MNTDNQTGIIPPHNSDAEASLLGSILIDEDAITKIADKIYPPDFYEKKHQTIYEAMLSLYEKRKPIDLLTLSDKLRSDSSLDEVGGATYLTELTNMVPSAAHVEHYADIVRTKSIRRRLIKVSEEMAKLGYTDNKPLPELLEEAESSLFGVSQTYVKQDLVSLERILSESFDRLDELHKDRSKIRGLPTGYRDVDNLLAGLQPSDLIILAARPSMGKSTLAMNIAHHVATKEKQSVLVFSLEMSKEQLVDRLLAAEAGIDAWNIRTGNLSDEDFERLGHAMGTLSEAPIYIDDTPAISVMEMRTKARREQHTHPLGLIIVDYLQLMSSNIRSFSDNRVQEVSEISRGLKGIARELNVPVIALSQLSRSVESRTPPVPQLSDLRESGSIEQDADVVAFIYREEWYNPETDRQHIADILIKKHRNGPTGSVELFFHPETLQFRTIDKRHEAPIEV